MLLISRLLIFLAVITCALSGAVMAANWPRSINIAGFNIADINGSLNDDGSGIGTGKVRVPGVSEIIVTLTRNSSGTVRAASTQRFSIGGISVEGSSELDSNGFKGSGNITGGELNISNAGYRLSAQGTLAGNGYARMGNSSIPVSFNIQGRKINISGSTSRQSTASTPLAYYTFKGDIRVGYSGSSLSATASGIVERKGKVGNVVNAFGPLSSSVNIGSGQASFSVAGVNVSFRF